MLTFTDIKPTLPTGWLQHIKPLHRAAKASAKVAGFCPQRLRNQLFQPVLNHALKALLEEGELDFLKDRSCAIQVRDTRLRSVITNQRNKLVFLPASTPAEVTISSSSDGFLNLVTQNVDPDTLFFRRELLIEGDVELGLYLKNMLDALTAEDLPPLYQRAMAELKKLARIETAE